jgi:hypothetical protein
VSEVTKVDEQLRPLFAQCKTLDHRIDRATVFPFGKFLPSDANNYADYPDRDGDLTAANLAFVYEEPA